MTHMGVIPVSRTLVAQLSRTLGKHSAASRAFDEHLDRSLAGEENLGFFMVPETHMILVGPRE